MDTVDDKSLDDFLVPLQDGECSPEHDARIKSKVRATLDKIEAGDMTFHALDDVMREFGFNAR